MGFCSEKDARAFLGMVPPVERTIVNSGIILLKYWLEVTPEEQTRRLEDRIQDKRKLWKLSGWTEVLQPVVQTTHAPATRCSRPRTRNSRHGSSCPPTTSGGPA